MSEPMQSPTAAAAERPGPRLKAYREARNISLRQAARELHVVHPALKDWESEDQVPSPPFREAIEVWTHGEIRADSWPLSLRERKAVEDAAKVVPCAESVTQLASDGEGSDDDAKSTGT